MENTYFPRIGNQADALRRLTAPADAGYPFDRAETGQPQRISLAEHDRTLGIVIAENARLKVERVKFVAALTEFRDSHWSAASADKLLNLLDALCGPKEMVCPPLS